MIKTLKRKLSFLKVYNSPFIRPKLDLYIGKVKYGTPYFVPKGIFDFKLIPLGWKTKWYDTDYRFEYHPRLCLVIFRIQIILAFKVPSPDEYWTAWLYYIYNTDKTKTVQKRINDCKKNFPLTYNINKQKNVDYYNYILKNKFR